MTTCTCSSGLLTGWGEVNCLKMSPICLTSYCDPYIYSSTGQAMALNVTIIMFDLYAFITVKRT